VKRSSVAEIWGLGRGNEVRGSGEQRLGPGESYSKIRPWLENAWEGEEGRRRKVERKFEGYRRR